MTSERDIERILDQWFSDGPIQAPDRVIDVVADRIEHQPQGPAWHLPRRRLVMNTNVKLAGAAVVAIAIALVGYNLLPAPAGVGGPTSSATPTQSAPPSATASPTPPSLACEDEIPGCLGPLEAGSHLSTRFGPKLRYSTPSGWTNSIDAPTILKLDSTDGSGPSILIWADMQIAEQTNSCDPIAKVGAGHGVQDWVDFVASHPGLDAGEPMALEFAQGQATNARSIDVGVAPDWTTTCPTHDGPYVMLLTDAKEVEYGVPADQRVHLVFLEAGGNGIAPGETVIIEVYGPLSPAAFADTLADVQSLIASFSFGCGVSVPRPCGAG